ncbi:MAG: phosphoenolpyruvate synthase [Muribaculaceae bacterium]|nr:phosphoenolpyruvate synthase [Muribaculaceae bacterium]
MPRYLKETEFQKLMQKRIFTVLLIATPYDSFMLEEDGRVEEQVYFEYVDLHLSSPPRFVKAATYEEAKALLKEMTFDLIIAMPGVDISETFKEAKIIDSMYPQIPFVVLTPFSKEVRRRIANEDLAGVDYVFSWLGDVDLILAIIKLIEDRMNAENDILNIGVQCIVVVEDSIRFYSSVLPHLFRYLFIQSREFSTEALNEHERMLRMRGRPKVLLARDYEEAQALFDKYGENILGVISDMRFPHGGVKDPNAGISLAETFRQKYPFTPVILESQESGNRTLVEQQGYLFLDKNSKTFPQELRKAVEQNFGFGDFVVRNPVDGKEIMRIPDLKTLQREVFNIPDDALYAHCRKNDVSRWLYSRALFPIAEIMKKHFFNRIEEADSVKELIFDSIVKYRRMKNRGVVAIFVKDRFDRYSNFQRIGEGSLGGKGRGLAFIDHIIKRYPECDDINGVQITIPRTVVLCTDIFDNFMEYNGLYRIGLSNLPDSEILTHFLKSKLPEHLLDDFRALFDVIDKPLAIRSSSLLEDSHYQPFAGIYATYMVPCLDDREEMLRLLCDAIKGVYASVFYADSKAYMNATSNVIEQEKMAIIIQEVVGEWHGDYYYPSFSGVGRSINYYPVGEEKSEDGVVEVAAGLGKYIVDGGLSLRFSPKHPDHVLQTSTIELALRDTQKNLYGLSKMAPQREEFSTDDGFNIKKIPVAEAFKTDSLRYLVSTFDPNDRVLRDTDWGPGRKVVTFANVLRQEVFPLATATDFMLSKGEYAMGRPVEIEFAGIINPKATSEEKKGSIYWLQIRPIVDKKEMLDDSILDVEDKDLILRSEAALGHGVMDNVRHLLYVKPGNYTSANNPALALEIDKLNRELTENNEPYILVGPGRWGSADNALGVPVRWPQIAGARLIVEMAIPGYRIEPSQGTHFFQNLTSFGVGYFTIDPTNDNGYFDIEFLDSLPAKYESEMLRLVEFPESITIAINGMKSRGIVKKPIQNAGE